MYFSLILQTSSYPNGFPQTFRIAFVPESRQLVVEYQLPDFGVVREDRRQNYGEDRFILLGMIQERLLAVCYAMRDKRVRIISARFAEPRERRRYNEENS